jgi:hypothetical protein
VKDCIQQYEARIEKSRITVRDESQRLVFNTKDLVHKAKLLKYGGNRNVEANGDVYFEGQTSEH